MIRTKSIQSPPRPEDGLRILASRFRGHRVPKTAYDVWMPNLGPSEQLLRRFKDGKVTWAEFSRKYLDELFAEGEVDAKNGTILNHGQKFTLRLLRELGERGNITLMCQCPEEEQHCHRHLLKKILLSKKI